MPRHRRIISVLGSLALLTAGASARADCWGPQASLRWTYPDESSGPVPPDALFWAVSHTGEVEVEVDGVPLSPRGTGPLERHQFVAATPLVEGEHEFVARVTPVVEYAGSDDGFADERERRLTFQVTAQQPVAGDVAISSVTIYPLRFDYTSGTGLLNPPEDEYDTECSQRAAALEWTCDDLIPGALARVAYESNGNAVLGYLVQGNYLVPPGCASFWTSSGFEPDPARFRAAALLPTGVGEVHTFAGPIEQRTFEDTHPAVYSRPSACSITFERQSPSPLAAVGLALAAWCARRRR